MELLLGALVTLVVQGIKKANAKWGKEMTKAGVLLVTFLLVLAGTITSQSHLISPETIAFIVKSFSIAIATYEVVYKRVLVPVFAMLSDKLQS